MLAAGKLDRLVTIKQLAAGQDTSGQLVQTWSTVASVWANVLHKSGAESIRADADVSIVQASVRIRARTGITAGMRVDLGSAVYQIKAVLSADRVYTDLVCELVG